MVITLLINLPFIAAGAFCVYHAVKRGVIAGRKMELEKKRSKQRRLESVDSDTSFTPRRPNLQ